MYHTATLARMYAVLNDHNLEGFSALLSEDFVEHETPPGGFPTRDGTIEFFRMQMAAFPDLAILVDDVVDAGEKVVARYRITGTHEGELLGIPPTGRSVSMEAIDIFRFDREGLICEHWGVADQKGMMEQLGIGIEVRTEA